MQAFDFEEPEQPETPKAPQRKRSASGCALWNLLTFLVLLIVGCIVIWFLAVFTNPSTPLNPFPPPELPTAPSLPTATPTGLVQLPPTWTAEPTATPTVSPTPRPTSTPLPTATPFSLIDPTTSTLEATPGSSGRPFVLDGEALAIQNIANNSGCDWMGVVGQIKDMRGSPINGQVVQLGGVLPGVASSVDQLTLSGVTQDFGAGYYEFQLADRPIASRGTLWVQLYDQSGVPVSDKAFFETYVECEKNMIVLNFQQVR